jgi:DNA repair protein RecO (recombination protein O)
MLHRTEGIVLRTSPFGEADTIVTYLTKDFGILKTFAKSPRKLKSRFGSSLEPLTHSRISFWGKEDATLPRLTQSDIIHSFYSIRETFQCYVKVLELIEIILHFVPERDLSRRVYLLLMNILNTVETGCNTELLIIYFKFKLLETVGYLPKLDCCGRCGKEGDAFYVSHGTVLCERCAGKHDTSFRVSAGAINLSSNLLVWNPSKIERIKPSPELIRELIVILDEHLKFVTERTFKTKSFNL